MDKREYLNIIKISDCSGCGACAAVCPKSCIDITVGENGFILPMVDLDTCINCKKCDRTCPVLNSSNTKPSSAVKSYAAKNSSKDVSLKSSSGGAFSVFATNIISNGGAVYGVVLNSKLEAEHIRVTDINDLYKLRGSKYLQSINTPSIYRSVKKDLNNGVAVLFSGTPCQIGGLYSYLGTNPANLITLEVVCHGIPSYDVFKRYILSLEEKNGDLKVRGINFRDKTDGWSKNRIKFTFEDGTEFSQLGSENSFMKGYIQNLYIRDSCFNCKFKDFKSKADLLLGDMWGVQNMLPGYSEENGVSLICTASDKGCDFFKTCLAQFNDVKEVSYEDVKVYNECIIKSVKPNERSEEFFEKYKIEDFDKLIHRLTKPKFSAVVKRELAKQKHYLYLIKQKLSGK